MLERRLSEAGRNAEVINTGVGGYSTDQVLLFLTRSGFQYSPDMVVYQACFNDIPDNAKSLAEGIYRKPRFELTDDGRMELKDCPVPEMGAGARVTYWFSRHSRLLYFLKHRLHLLQAGNAPDAPPPSTAPTDEVDYAFRLFCALNRKIQEECVSRGIAYVVLIDFELGPVRKRFWEADCREVKAFFLKDYLDRRAKTAGRPSSPRTGTGRQRGTSGSPITCSTTSSPPGRKLKGPTASPGERSGPRHVLWGPTRLLRDAGDVDQTGDLLDRSAQGHVFVVLLDELRHAVPASARNGRQVDPEAGQRGAEDRVDQPRRIGKRQVAEPLGDRDV